VGNSDEEREFCYVKFYAEQFCYTKIFTEIISDIMFKPRNSTCKKLHQYF